MSDKPLTLPPQLAAYLGEYLPVEDATLVTTDAPQAPAAPAKLDVWVSYVPRLRCFSAHREGIGTIRAGSLPELLSKLAEAMPGAAFGLHLSRVARREIGRRKNGGGPMAAGWH